MKRNTFVLLFCSLLLGVVVSCAPPPVEPDGEVSTNPPANDATAQNDPSSITEGDLAQGNPEIRPGSSMDDARKNKPSMPGPLANVYFGFDRSDLDPAAREVLQRNSDWIKQNPAVNIEIEGHADSRGATEYNLALGARRAQAVMDYLVTLGNAPDRLSTISYGEELSVHECINPDTGIKIETEECWGKNRRVHFVVRSPKPAS